MNKWTVFLRVKINYWLFMDFFKWQFHMWRVFQEIPPRCKGDRNFLLIVFQKILMVINQSKKFFHSFRVFYNIIIKRIFLKKKNFELLFSSEWTSLFDSFLGCLIYVFPHARFLQHHFEKITRRGTWRFKRFFVSFLARYIFLVTNQPKYFHSNEWRCKTS